jgi:hypothetical protein
LNKRNWVTWKRAGMGNSKRGSWAQRISKINNMEDSQPHNESHICLPGKHTGGWIYMKKKLYSWEVEQIFTMSRAWISNNRTM